jgi:hypothetical protein
MHVGALIPHVTTTQPRRPLPDTTQWRPPEPSQLYLILLLPLSLYDTIASWQLRRRPPSSG